jgi:hypothetical protein
LHLGALGRERGHLALELVDHRAERDREDALAALQQVDHLLRVVDGVHRGAVGDQRHVGERLAAGVELLDGRAHPLQRDAGVEQALDHPQLDHVVEAVQALRARCPRPSGPTASRAPCGPSSRAAGR